MTGSQKALASKAAGYQLLPLSKLVSNPNQPRQLWDTTKDEDGKTRIERLAQSIKAEGLLQPLVVTPRNGKYMVVCGERRFRAAQLLKLNQVPCVVRSNVNEKEMLELSITENLQREDLTPMDEARALKTLIDTRGYTQLQVAKRLGLSEAAVNFKLGLLKLTPELQKSVHKGQMNETHGRTIVHQVFRIKGKDAQKKQQKAMQRIHKRIEKMRASDTQLDSKQIKAVAQTAVEEQLAGPTRKRRAARKSAGPAKPTKSERERVRRFSRALGKAQTALKPYEAIVDNAKQRDRLADLLLMVQEDAAQQLKDTAHSLNALHEAVQDAKRRSLAAKQR